MKRIPADGILGQVALREARATELSEVMVLVSRAVEAVASGSWMQAMYPDRVIVRRNGRLYAYPYTLGDDNSVSLGDPAEVVLNHEPVALREAVAADDSHNSTTKANDLGRTDATQVGGATATFIEAVKDDPTGSSFLVCVIKSGLSNNHVLYPAAVLREAAAQFEGARVFAKNDDEHVRGARNDVNKLVGALAKARFVETATGGEIQAVFQALDSAPITARLREAVQRGMQNIFGLSIDAVGECRRGRSFIEATSIQKVRSVDLVIDAAAGGGIVRFAEATREDSNMNRNALVTAILAAMGGIATASAEQVRLVESMSDEQLVRFRESFAGTPATATATHDDINARFAVLEARNHATTALAGSQLPQPAKDRLQARFREAANLTVAQVDAEIKAEADYLARFVEAGRIVGLGDGRVEAGQDQAQKWVERMDALLSGKDRRASFREAYIDFTGDREVTGLIDNCDMRRMRDHAPANFREAISAATFGNVLGSSVARQMVAEYAGLDSYQDYRDLVDIVPIRDFRTNERTRMGGYGNLPAVAENGAYNALTSPTDEKATYAISKRGGTETISLETIANDDVGALRRVPRNLAVAAGRTLYEFVLDFLATNAAIYDSVALFHASHANLGTTALSAATFAASRLRMKKQAELSSAKRLGITLRHLYVPSDLEETAFDLFVRGTNNDETFAQSRKPKVHVVDYWTDTNNWYATADKAQVPLIELGFYGGNETPELFIQDNPTQGSLFSNDQIKMKIRHAYSGAVLDFRGFDGNVVP